MTFTYKFYKTDKQSSENDAGITKIEGEKLWFIPENTENVMWQENLKWLAEGNTPEAAD